MKQYKWETIVSFFILLIFCTGCAHDSIEPAEVAVTKPSISSEIQTGSRELAKKQQERHKALESRPKRAKPVAPVLPQYDPLEAHKVSFSMVNEKLETVFYLLAESVGMNLILDSALVARNHVVTMNFQNVSAKTVLKELTDQFDLDFIVRDNLIRISTQAERFFTLNFLDTNLEMAFDVGGDVLGGGNSENATGLSGSVTISGTGPEKANPYVILEQMVDRMTSDEGVFAINKISGSLYIKDRPSIVKTVEKQLNHFKEMLSRQILIEARIIEVTLSKGFEYGIDWSLIEANSSATSLELSELAWDLTNGLVFDGYNGSFSFSSIITALETFGKVKIVSNPTIRAKHSSPAIISVGDSITYKRSVEVTTEQTELGETETTEVEVSTVFDGLILGVVPFIEPHGKINLLINPVKSDVDTESIENPESVGAGVTISLPKVGIKEISTTISVNDGDIIVLGGLISSEDVKRDKDVPLVSKIPLLGKAFQNDYVSEERKELVIILNVKRI